MKKSRFCFTTAAVCLMVFGLSMSAQAKTTYRLEITNQYDTGGTSRDDNDKEREHPLEPDVEVSENSSDAVELASDVEWSKDPLNWSAGNEVTGTLYLGCTGSLGRDGLELRVTNGSNEAKVSSVKKYTGEDYESDLGNVYQVKFKYQVAAQLGETAWAGSSSRMNFGLMATARAISVRRRSPPESWMPRLLRTLVRRNSSIRFSSRSA